MIVNEKEKKFYEIDTRVNFLLSSGATTLSITALNITIPSITVLSISMHAESHLCRVSFMLSVANKPVMLRVIMLSVVMLNVVAPSVMAGAKK